MDMNSQVTLSCFVIGPIGDRLAPVGSLKRTTYEAAYQVLTSVIEPACRSHGLTPIRADHITSAGEITEQVFKQVRDADVVIAGVTDGNPNVMYELGLRHTRNAITIQIGEKSRLPFDISVIRTIQFARTVDGLEEAREALQSTLKTSIAGQAIPVTATRLWIEAGATRRSLSLGHLRPGRLERVHEMKGAMSRLTDGFAPLSSDIVKQLNRAVHTLRTKKEELDNTEAEYADCQPIFRETADALRELADRTENLVSLFASDIQLIADGIDHLLDKFSNNPQDPEVFVAPSLAEFIDTMQTTLRTLASSIHRAGTVGELHRLFREPAERIVASFEQLPVIVRPLSDRRVRLAAFAQPFGS